MRRAALLCLALCLCLGAGAQESERKAQLEEAITNQTRFIEQRQEALEAIRTELGSLSTALGERLGERERVSGELTLIQNERGALLSEIETLNTQIADVEAQIAVLDDQLADLKVRVRGLLVNLYKQGSSRSAEILSQAESFHDLRVKNHYLSLLSQQDIDLIEEIDAAAAQLFSLQDTNRSNLAELNAKEAALRSNEAELESKGAELDALVAELELSYEGQLSLQQARLEEQAELERTLNALVSDLDRENERIAELVRQRERAEAAVSERNREGAAPPETGPATSAGPELPPLVSGYVYPLTSPKLVRSFGESGFPNVRLQSREAGAAVYAVQPGIVFEVGLVSANQGHLVVIQHDEGLFTTYVNLQAAPPVRPGDRVSQNEVIGYLGGGALIPADVLEFYTGWFEAGKINYTDPATLLGF